MPVVVKVVGGAERLFKRSEYCFDHRPGMIVKDILDRLSTHASPEFASAIYDADRGLMNENAVVFVNSREIRSLCYTGTVLENGDVVTIMPPPASSGSSA